VTYRIEAHTTSDDPTRYRSDDDVEPWRARDPVTRLERYLRTEHGMRDEEVEEAERVAEAAAARVRAWADEAPAVEPESMFEHVYVDPPARFAEQRLRLVSEIAQHQEHQH
jgi:pyruvate dehydrogenase E1 component alpha subunit